jgi:excisionase family DNA binding protein
MRKLNPAQGFILGREIEVLPIIFPYRLNWLKIYFERGRSMEKRLLNVPEVADYLGFSVSAIRKWVRRGMIPFNKVNGGIRFDINGSIDPKFLICGD